MGCFLEGCLLEGWEDCFLDCSHSAIAHVPKKVPIVRTTISERRTSVDACVRNVPAAMIAPQMTKMVNTILTPSFDRLAAKSSCSALLICAVVTLSTAESWRSVGLDGE